MITITECFDRVFYPCVVFFLDREKEEFDTYDDSSEEISGALIEDSVMSPLALSSFKATEKHSGKKGTTLHDMSKQLLIYRILNVQDFCIQLKKLHTEIVAEVTCCDWYRGDLVFN